MAASRSLLRRNVPSWHLLRARPFSISLSSFSFCCCCFFFFFFLFCISGHGGSAAMAAGDLSGDLAGLIVLKNALNILPWSNISSNISSSSSSSSNISSDVCGLEGVTCRSYNNTIRVSALRLPGDDLSGAIPAGSIGRLTELRVLSLRFNNLSGSLPEDLSNCAFLRSLYLQSNHLSGSLPSDFAQWPNLVHLDLSSNGFSGPIPASIADLSQLKSLYLHNNSLSGALPPLEISSLAKFSVAFNQLNGSIPNTTTLSRFPQSSFVGNPGLCGSPLPPCAASSPSPASSSQGRRRKKLSGAAIAGIVLACILVPFLLLTLWALLFNNAAGRGKKKGGDPLYAAASRSAEAMDGGGGGSSGAATELLPGANHQAAQESSANNSKLVFFEGAKYSFDLDDLLRASAEVLGRGSVGTAYKAVLENGSIVAVKRLKDVSIERQEFEQHMVPVGKLRHPNLVPMVAYFYSREEKLLVNEYMTNGSLSALLHGSKGVNRTPLDWDTRVKIAAGAAMGIEHLHDRGFTHGNIKSCNVLLTSSYSSCVSDYGLAQMVSTTPAANRVMGYRAPELTDPRKMTPEADVYSFGVLLLELLTGKAPSQASTSEEGVDLPRWVRSVAPEDWKSQVFDPELVKYQADAVDDEMASLLQIALQCIAPSPALRPSMKALIKLLQDLQKSYSDASGDMVSKGGANQA